MSQALYRKWRPQSWDAVIGQDQVVQTLRNAIAADRVMHAYLFAGPRGTGKTTTARLLAKAVNCLDENRSNHPCNQCINCQAVNQSRFMDLIEIDAASNTSVEDVRDLREKINFLPTQGIYKVYIIDEVHMLSTAAFNALLKTLEEPPAHAIFILATTEVHKIPATVMSRCQRHEFRRIPNSEIIHYLGEMAAQEGIQVEPTALLLIARQSTGSMRDAISLLDQLASTNETITLKMAQTVLGTATSQHVLDLIEALIQYQPAAGLDNIYQALDAGSDPRQFARQIVEYLRGLLLIKSGNKDQVDATSDLIIAMNRHAQAFDNPKLLRMISLFNEAANETRGAWQPSLPLEVAFISAGEILSVTAPSASFFSVKEDNQEPIPIIKEQTPLVQQASEKTDLPAEELGSADHIFRLVVDNWRQILSQVRQYNPGTQGLLNSCKPGGVKESTLYLGCNSDFVRKRMETGDNLELTRRAISQVIGMDLPVRCYVATGGSGSLPPEVESDGMVAAAVRDLGGKILDVQ